MSYEPAADRYDRMLYRRCGRSGLRLPAVSLGLWWNFGHDRPLETSRAIVRRAFDLGVTHFDLANNYGPPYGSAEENFGRTAAATTWGRSATSSSSRRKPATTCGRARTASGAPASTSCASLDQSLARMGLEYVDIFYSHRFDPDTPLEETMGALDAAVRQGKALYVGISSYSAERTAEAAAILRELGTPLLIHQPSYSMLNRWIEPDLLDTLGALGVGCIGFSPLAQGMLTDRYLERHPGGLEGEPSGVALARSADRGDARRRSGAPRGRGRAGSDAGADGARVDAARPAHDLDGHRCEQRRAARDEPRGARPARLHPRRAGGDRPPRHRQRHQPLG